MIAPLLAQTHTTANQSGSSLILQLSALLTGAAAMLTIIYQAIRNRKATQRKTQTDAEKATVAATRTAIEANKSAVDIYGQLVHELRVELTELTVRVEKCESQREEQSMKIVHQEGEIADLRREVAFVRGVQAGTTDKGS